MPSTYTTQQGDMWDLVAFRLWGRETLFHHLLAANPAHREAVVFGPGVVLTVPELPAGTQLTTADTRPPWRR
ncbi:tail protein X [Megalodesulfovibrio paquesii]